MTHPTFTGESRKTFVGLFFKNFVWFFFRLKLSRLRGLSKRHSRQSGNGDPIQTGDEELQQPDEDERTETAEENHQRETEIN